MIAQNNRFYCGNIDNIKPIAYFICLSSTSKEKLMGPFRKVSSSIKEEKSGN